MTEFAWPNGLTSTAATGFSLALLLSAPAVGAAIDRFGARPVIALGAVATSSGFIWVGHCHTQYEMIAAFVLAGVGDCAAFYVSSAVVVSNWMDSKKALGMGIVWSAMSIGAALFSMLIGRWIEEYGWREASEILAALAASVLPLAWLTLRINPSRSDTVGDPTSAIAKSSKTGRALFVSGVFIAATSSSALFSVGMGGIYYHVVSVLIKAGYATHSAGLVFGASWIMSAVGSLVLGAGADRYGAKMILTVGLLLCGVGTLFLLGVGEQKSGVACVVAFVILWGASANCVNQIVPVILAERYGSRSLGTLIGVWSSIIGLSGAVAPIVTGVLYDKFTGYRIPIYLSASTIFLAFVVSLLITAPKSACSNSDLKVA